MPEVKSKPVVKPAAEVKPKAVAKPKPATKPAAAKTATTTAKAPAKPKAAATAKVAAKTATAPKTRAKKSAAVSITPEERYQMIAKAAYFRAEKRGFAPGDTAQDWLDAEEEIERMLQTPAVKSKAPPITPRQALAFQKKLDTQIQEWDAKLAELKAKAQEATVDIRADYEKQFETLTAKRAQIQTKTQELRTHAGDAWEDLKLGTEKAWVEMQKALDKIATRFK